MKHNYLPIYLLTFVNTIGFSLLVPILPYIVESYGGGAIIYGFMLTAYSAFQFIGAPILGALSDKYGRRPLLMISQAGTLASWFIFGLAYFLPDSRILGLSVPLIIIAISRVIDGITGGNISVANAYVSDLAAPENRSKIFGTIGAIFGIGFILGPALGGLTSATSIGYLGTLIVAAIISTITLWIIYKYLPESLTPEHRDDHLDVSIFNQINIWDKFRSYKDNQIITKALLIRLVFGLAFAAYISIIVVYIKDEFNFNQQQSGFVFLVIGLFIFINQGFVVKKLIHHLGDYKTLYLGQLLIGLGFLTLSFTPNLIFFFINAYIINLGITSSMPTTMAILINETSPRQRGKITGLSESLGSFSTAITPILAGFLYQLIHQLMFVVLALLFILFHIILHAVYHPKPSPIRH